MTSIVKKRVSSPPPVQAAKLRFDARSTTGRRDTHFETVSSGNRNRHTRHVNHRTATADTRAINRERISGGAPIDIPAAMSRVHSRFE
jgi:hypothetical protein